MVFFLVCQIIFLKLPAKRLARIAIGVVFGATGLYNLLLPSGVSGVIDHYFGVGYLSDTTDYEFYSEQYFLA